MHDTVSGTHWHEPKTGENAGKGKFGRPKGPYDRFMEDEDVPIYRGVGVHKVQNLPMTPWKRMGGKGTYIQLHGTEGKWGSYVVEVPGAGALNAEKHLYEEVYYVVEGRGKRLVIAQLRRQLEWPWAWQVPLVLHRQVLLRYLQRFLQSIEPHQQLDQNRPPIPAQLLERVHREDRGGPIDGQLVKAFERQHVEAHRPDRTFHMRRQHANDVLRRRRPVRCNELGVGQEVGKDQLAGAGTASELHHPRRALEVSGEHEPPQ